MCFITEDKTLFVATEDIQCYKTLTRTKDGRYLPLHFPQNLKKGYVQGQTYRKRSLTLVKKYGDMRGQGGGFHSFKTLPNYDRRFGRVTAIFVIPKGATFYQSYAYYFSKALRFDGILEPGERRAFKKVANDGVVVL